ncbi:MAG: hypothetical protein ACRC45_00595 [Cetobacterium sp.]
MRKIFRGVNIKKIMKCSKIDKREELIINMSNDNLKVAKKFENGEADFYISCPDYLIPVLEDGYERQNTLLMTIYLFGVKRINLTLELINEMFDVKYNTLREAKSNIFDWCWEDVGVDCAEIKFGRRIIGYKLKLNMKKVNELEKEFDATGSIPLFKK